MDCTERGLGPEEGYSSPGSSRGRLRASQVFLPGPPSLFLNRTQERSGHAEHRGANLSLEIEALRNLGMRAVSGAVEKAVSRWYPLTS